MKTTAIFDLDGLLIDSELVLHRIFNTLLDDGKKEERLSVEEYAHTYCGRPLKENIPMFIDCFHLSIDSTSAIHAVTEREAHNAGIDVICVPDMKEPDEKRKQMAVSVLPNLRKAIDWLGNKQ